MKTIHLVVEMNAPDQKIQDPEAATTETNPGRIVKILRKEEENRKNPPIIPIGNQGEESQTGKSKGLIIQENLTTKILPLPQKRRWLKRLFRKTFWLGFITRDRFSLFQSYELWKYLGFAGETSLPGRSR
jgi:hypothetical protein